MLTNEIKLIEIVLRLFMDQGSKFKMEDVASEMRISKKTIYSEYGNKEALIMMVVKAIIEGIDHRLHAIMETDEYNTLEKLILITCAFPDAKDIDYHKAMFIRDEFPKQYDMFLHYIEDNWSVSKALFNQCIQEGYIRSVDHDVFKVIILGITKQVLSMDDTDQELLLEKSVRMVFDGLVIR